MPQLLRIYCSPDCENDDALVRGTNVFSFFCRARRCSGCHSYFSIRRGSRIAPEVRFNVRRVYTPVTGTMHYLELPKGEDLGTCDDRKYGTWCEHDRGGSIDLYVSCIGCGGVNKISTNRISVDGTSQCFACIRCGCIQYVALEDWEEHRVPPIPL